MSNNKNFIKSNIRSFHIHRLLPNIITLTSICFGLTSIRFALDQKWEIAVSFIVIAGVLDILDGRIARMLNASSKFGAHLDSLADFINFGVAPAIIMYLALFKHIEMRGIGWGLVLFYAICNCLRLARFNTYLENIQRPEWMDYYFAGIPAPAGAFLIVMPLMASFKVDVFVIGIIPFYIYTIIISLLMISKVPTVSTKKIVIKKEHVVFILMLFCLAIVFLITEPWVFLPIIGLTYLLSIPLSIISYKRKYK